MSMHLPHITIAGTRKHDSLPVFTSSPWEPQIILRKLSLLLSLREQMNDIFILQPHGSIIHTQ